MKKFSRSLVVILLLLTMPTGSLVAQSTVNSWGTIDKRVKSIQADRADSLARKLISFCKTDREKVRAIFRWITEHIGYDVVGYHDPNLYTGFWNDKDAADSSSVEKSYNDKIVHKVLLERTAICDGYARLFKTLCENAGIKCAIVTGNIRWSTDAIGEITLRRHAWNAVSVENGWHLVDATWASGHCDNNVTVFTKMFDDFFFLTDPIQLFNDHFPDDKTWALLPNIRNLRQFYNYPFYHPDFYRAKITWVQPTDGIVELKNPKRLINFELGVTGPVNYFYIVESSGQPHSVTHIDLSGDQVPFRIENGKLLCSYHVRSENPGRIDIFLNNKLILSYNFKVY